MDLNEEIRQADEWRHHPAPRKDLFIEYVTLLGINVGEFEQDIDVSKWVRKAERDKADGKLLGVNGTPTFIVKGERAVNLTYQDLRLSIKRYLDSGRK